MKLDYKDIQRIAEEVERQEIRFLQSRLDGEYYACLHEDAGDRV